MASFMNGCGSADACRAISWRCGRAASGAPRAGSGRPPLCFENGSDIGMAQHASPVVGGVCRRRVVGGGRAYRAPGHPRKASIVSRILVRRWPIGRPGVQQVERHRPCSEADAFAASLHSGSGDRPPGDDHHFAGAASADRYACLRVEPELSQRRRRECVVAAVQRHLTGVCDRTSARRRRRRRRLRPGRRGGWPAGRWRACSRW